VRRTAGGVKVDEPLEFEELDVQKPYSAIRAAAERDGIKGLPELPPQFHRLARTID
jgi:hypothetical protein